MPIENTYNQLQAAARLCQLCGTADVGNHQAVFHPKTVDYAASGSVISATRTAGGLYSCDHCEAVLDTANDAQSHLRSHPPIPSVESSSQDATARPPTEKILSRPWSTVGSTLPERGSKKPKLSDTTNDTPFNSATNARAPSRPRPRGRPQRPEWDSSLASLSIFVHKETRLVICTVCGNSVLPSRLQAHLTQRGEKVDCDRRLTIAPDRLKQKLDEAGALENVVFDGRQAIDPIPSVEIREDGLLCPFPTCNHPPCSKRSAYEAHWRQVHRGPPQDPTTVPFHSLYTGNVTRLHLLVKFPKAAMVQNRWDKVKEHLAVPKEAPQSSSSRPYASLTALERVLGWHHVLEGCDLSDLRSTVSARDQTDAMDAVEAQVRDTATHYVTRFLAPTLQGRNEGLFIRLSKASEQTPSPFKFGPLANEATVRNYSYAIAHLFQFLIHIRSSPVAGFTVNFTDQQKDALYKLLLACKNAMSTMQDRCNALHASFWSIMTQMPSSSTHSPTELPLISFLIARHASHGDGDLFSSADSLNHCMIAIQWCWRAACYAYCISNSSSAADNSPIKVFEREVERYVLEGEHTPFASMRIAIHQVTHVVHSNPSMAQFTMTYDRRAFTFQGTPITINSYKTFVRDLVANAEQRLESLLLHASIDALETRIKDALRVDLSDHWFPDSPRENANGYSFLSAGPSPLTQFEDVLIAHMFRAENTEFATPNPDAASGETFNFATCRAWLTSLDGLVEQLFCATIFSWPGAARGSELQYLQYRNCHTQRNVFFVNGLLTFVAEYNKTTAIDGTSALIPRAVPPRVARMFIILFAVLYPCAARLCMALEMPSRARLYQNFVFVHRNLTMDPVMMTTVLQQRTETGLKCKFGLRHTRQLVIFIMKNAIRITLEEGEESAALDILHDLCGHSARTAEAHYAVESNTIHEVSSELLQQSHKLALAFQAFFGLGYDILPPPPKDEEKHRLAPVNHADLGPISRTALDAAVCSSISRCLPRLSDAVGVTISQHISQYHPQSAEPSHSPRTPPAQSVVVHPSLLHAVGRMYGTAHPRFSSPEQATALELIRQGQHNVICILPTGGGKSLMFYAPSFFEPTGVTVVISPLVALCRQQYKAASAMGICCTIWPSKPEDGFRLRLAIVPAHALADPTLLTWLSSLLTCGLLRRIIFDEAHEVLVSDSYRSCYSGVSALCRLGVPTHFLTATLMRKSVPALLEKTGLVSETVRVVSAPTARTNLKYDVLDFRPGRPASHPGSMYDILQERFEEAKATLKTEERILIFCSDYKECDTIANLLSLPCYKAKDDNATPEEWSLTKAKIQDEWFLGNPPSLVATTAFSLGIDHPHVRFAFVVNAYDLMSVVQMTGRAGRTRGSRGTCVILADNAPCAIDDQIDHRGRRLLIDLYNNTNCARITLGSFDDRAYSCYAMPDAEICSYCARLTASGISLQRQHHTDSPPQPDSPIVPVPLPIKPLDYHPSLSANNAAPASQPNDYSLPRRHLPDEIANHSASHPPEISSVAPSRVNQLPFTPSLPAPTLSPGRTSSLPSPTSTHTRRGVFARPSREAPAPPLRFPSAPSPIHADTQRRPSHHISPEVFSDVFYAREAAPNRSPAALSIPVAGPSSLFPPTTTERVKKAFDYLLNLKARACLPCTVMLRVDKAGKQCGHILRCATGLFLQGSETGTLWKTEFQTQLRYPADRRICFRCSFPSLVFPHQPKDKECSSYDDIVKVVAFSIYNLKNLEEAGPRLQSRLLERMAERDGQIWASITKFRKWAELPSASGFVNIHELVAAWSEMQEERQWSA